MNTLATMALIFAPSFINNTTFVQPTDGSNLDQVMEKFNTGTEPEFASVIGWWTGRCYLPASPNSPFGILMVSTQTEDKGEDNGPQFPPIVKVINRMSWIGQTYRAPAFYDEMNDELKQSIRSFETSEEFSAILAVSANGSLNADNVAGNLRYTIRKNGDYFFGPATLLNDSGENKAGSVFAGCYFFKKVN